MSEDKITQDNNNDGAANTDDALTEKAQTEGNQAEETQKDEVLSDALPKQTSKEESQPEQSLAEQVLPDQNKKKSNIKLYQVIRIACFIGFIVFTALFINETVIQPYRIKKSIELTRDLYNKPTELPEVTAAPTEAPVEITPAAESEPTPEVTATPTPDPNRDEKGRLLQFADLLSINEDVKGWISIKDTNIDYVVMQSASNDPNYYLDKDINGEYSKAGTLYLDPMSSVEEQTQNLLIHGHNMVSTTEKMFHYLLKYKELDYYKEHPLINFDTILDTGEWKIFAVFITPGDADSKDFFDYRISEFNSSSDFLNFIYQIRIRSVLNIDTVDIQEDDQLLSLSTCSYELDNYRTVIVARKVREGEDSTIDTDSATVNKTPLYPSKYYKSEGGEAPEVANTFEEALANGQISWYTPTEDATE